MLMEGGLWKLDPIQWNGVRLAGNATSIRFRHIIACRVPLSLLPMRNVTLNEHSSPIYDYNKKSSNQKSSVKLSSCLNQPKTKQNCPC